MTKTMVIVKMINGINAMRAYKPTSSNTEQKNSANTAMPSEIVEPTPKGSANREARSEKFTSLGQPWVNIPAEKQTLATSNAKSSAIGWYCASFLIMVEVQVF